MNPAYTPMLRHPFAALLGIVVLLTGCKALHPANRSPIVDGTSKELGIIVHARVADPVHEYISSFEIADTGKPTEKAMSYEGNKPMHAMLIAVHVGDNTDTIHDEANGFDQFLLEPPATSSFTIASGKQYRATACSSSGMCSSMNFTLTRSNQ